MNYNSLNIIHHPNRKEGVLLTRIIKEEQMSLNSQVCTMKNISAIITKYLFQIAAILITLLAVNNGLQGQQTKSIILHFTRELKWLHSTPIQHIKTSQNLETINNALFRNVKPHIPTVFYGDSLLINYS